MIEWYDTVPLWIKKLYTELAKQVCPWLRDSASGRRGDFTQPGTNFFGHLCKSQFLLQN